MQCMRDGKLYWRGDGVDDMHALLDRALFGVGGHLAGLGLFAMCCGELYRLEHGVDDLLCL